MDFKIYIRLTKIVWKDTNYTLPPVDSDELHFSLTLYLNRNRQGAIKITNTTIKQMKSNPTSEFSNSKCSDFEIRNTNIQNKLLGLQQYRLTIDRIINKRLHINLLFHRRPKKSLVFLSLEDLLTRRRRRRKRLNRTKVPIR